MLITDGNSIKKFFNWIDKIGKIKNNKIKIIKKNKNSIIVVAIPLLILFFSR